MRLVAMAVVLMSLGVVWSAPPDPAGLRILPTDTEKAKALIPGLGDPDFLTRERKARQLSEMGRRALNALRDARFDPDPEVQGRVLALYERACIADMEARIDSFLADDQEKYHHEIPGWRKYRLFVGSTPASRELFTEVVRNRQNWPILQSLEGASESLTPGLGALSGAMSTLNLETPPKREIWKVVVAHRENLGDANNVLRRPVPQSSAKLVDIVPLLLAESFAPEESMPQLIVAMQRQYQLIVFFNTPECQQLIADTQGRGTAFRSLAKLWFDTRIDANQQHTVSFHAKTILKDNDLVNQYTIRALTNPNQGASQRVNILNNLSRTNITEALPHVVKIIKDDRVYIRQRAIGGYDLSVGDYALSVAINLTGQKQTDYGFGTTNNNDAAKHNTTAYYFMSDDKLSAEQKRYRAIMKWKSYEATTHAAAMGNPLAVILGEARYPFTEPPPPPPMPKAKPKADDD
ncbi:MAG: hypothetical protein ACRC8S_18465 [Fimbriiglobus sp.]